MPTNNKIALAFFLEHGLNTYCFPEFKFCNTRKWRFDYAFIIPSTNALVALEQEGAVWVAGRHTRGSGFVKDMEKYNMAAVLGWRIIRVQPKDLLTKDTVDMLKQALGITTPNRIAEL